MPISYSTTTKSAAEVSSNLLVIIVRPGLAELSALPKAVAQGLKEKAKSIQYDGAWGSSEMFISPDASLAPFIGLIGVGKEADQARAQEGIRRGSGKLAHEARKHLLHHIALQMDSAADVQAAYEGIVLANYRFAEHRKALVKEQKARAIRTITVISAAKDIRTRLKESQTILEGVAKARDLVNEPASHVTPAVLVKQAKEIAKRSPHISVKILDRKQAEKQGFTAFLAVAKGSLEEPYVIHLQYKPKQKAKDTVALVGKGITFDSGGLSLKPSNAMEDMKIDMAGAATVLGVFDVLTQLEVPVAVHGIIAACENMPSGNAYRPGDILQAKNGKTIEVFNTDAEGRITLADALVYAVEQKPTVTIDLATLTGAIVVALGDTHAGVWSNTGGLAEGLLRSAEYAGEGLVRFPLPDEYRPTIQSTVADVRNTATMERTGGAITAALFLQEFVGDAPWAHMDVAGPVYMSRQLLPYYMPGATGYGVRTLVHFLQNFKSSTIQK
ncbi:MAG: leucyl aminopeptidase [Candidatus Andersenbacteria bacterium]